MKLTKGTFMSKVGKGMEERSGYTFDLLLTNNVIKRMGVYKGEKSWSVIDLDTGMKLCTGRTRSEALETAKSQDLRERFAARLNDKEYGKLVREWKNMLDDAKPSVGPVIEAIASPETGGKLVKLYDKTKKAPAKPKADPLADALKRIEELTREVESLKAEKSAPVQEQATATSLDCILKEMQKWCEGKPNVSAYRKNSQPSTPVRIAGETRPYQKELTEKGFRWSPKGFWYMGERELARRG